MSRCCCPRRWPISLMRVILPALCWGVVQEEIDLCKITGTYGSERGQPPFNPVMTTALLLYCYCCGIYSSRRIAKACGERVDFMSIVGFDVPDFRTISEFRWRHLKALSALSLARRSGEAGSPAPASAKTSKEAAFGHNSTTHCEEGKNQ